MTRNIIPFPGYDKPAHDACKTRLAGYRRAEAAKKEAMADGVFEKEGESKRWNTLMDEANALYQEANILEGKHPDDGLGQ